MLHFLAVVLMSETCKDFFLYCPKMRVVGPRKRQENSKNSQITPVIKTSYFLIWDSFPADTSKRMILDAEKGRVKGWKRALLQLPLL